MRKTQLSIPLDKLEVSSTLLRALAHPLRLKILAFIDKHQSISVNKIYMSLDLEQSIASQHLRVLRTAALVKAEREGKFIHYSVDYARIEQAVKAIRNFLQEKKEEAQV
ncbi:MAG: ArsR/SmtB family transcription factor [Saprospiraceae bacterium]|jgi:DNA-binding transcriptional ArsR family regulator